MARDQVKSNTKNNLRQPLVPMGQGKRPQGIQKQQTLRKSLRLEAIRQSHKQSLSKSNHIQEVQAPLSPPASNIPEDRKRPQILHKPSTSSRKRKPDQGEQEEQEAGNLFSRTREQPPSKRLQISPPSFTAKIGLKKKKEKRKESASNVIETADPLKYWTLTKRWPKEYFEQHSQIREDLEQDSWLEE